MRESNFNLYLDKLKKYYWENWILPTFDTMIELVKVNSRVSVTKFFNKLVEEWYLSKETKKYYPTQKLTSTPLFWSVSCWSVDKIESNIVNYIDLNKYILWWNPTWIVLVEVKWDSMEDVWIFEWDIVSIDLNNKYPRSWDLVIATIDWDNEFTLKEYSKDKFWKTCLNYRNEKVYKSKIVEANQINIVWVVKWLVRKF